MPAPSGAGSTGGFIGGYGSPSGGGGGPNAGFAGSLTPPTVPRAPTPVGAPNPYADVGKFNLDVTSPSGFAGSLSNDQQNNSLIHGMTQAVFGQGTGSYLGGVPVLGDVGRIALQGGLENILGAGGNILGLVGDIPNPIGGAATLYRYAQAPDSPEKRLADAAAAKDPLSVLQIRAKYLADLDRKSADPNQGGIFALNPDLYDVTGSGVLGTNVGETVRNVMSIFGTTGRLMERTIAGMNQMSGTRLDSLAKADYSKLGPVEQEAVAKWKSGQWTQDHALDFLTANNAGYSDNPVVNIVLNAALDPLTWGTLGAGALAKGGMAVARGAEALAVAERAGAGAEEIARIKALGGVGPLSRFLGRTVGPSAYAVMSDPTLGPIARYAHNIIDPTRLLFHSGDAGQLEKSALSLEGTMGVAHSYGLGNLSKSFQMADQMESVVPGLANTLEQDMGSYTAGIVRNWAAQEAGRDAIRRNLGVTELGGPMEAIEAVLAKLPPEADAHVEQFNRAVTPLAVDARELSQRMAAAYGGTADTYLPRIEALNTDSRAVWHAATSAHARDDLLAATAADQASGVWKFKTPIDRVIMIGPGELSKQRAAQEIAAMNALKGADRIGYAQRVAQKYDALRYAADAVTSEPEVKNLIDTMRTMSREGLLSSELSVAQSSKLTGELANWMGQYGKSTEDGTFLWGLGFRPEDENLWRLVRDPKTDKIISMSPWVDYVAEKAPGYRPGAMRLPGPLGGPRGVIQTGLDWADIGTRQMLHGVTTARVTQEASRRFVQGAMGFGMNEAEARRTLNALTQAAKGGGLAGGETMIRGLSGDTMWQAAREVMPHEIAKNMTQRELVDLVLKAYANETRIVGVTQKFTGQLKYVLDHVPGLNTMGGGNVAGVVSENIWPSLKFRFNPLFQVQELWEGPFFGTLKGVRPYLRGEVPQLDEQAYKVWGSWDRGLESAGDQIEGSAGQLYGKTGASLGAMTGLRRVKYVNASRQFRHALGEMGEKYVPAEDLTLIKAHYGTLNTGEAMVRYMTEQLQQSHDVLGEGNSFEDLIKSADWAKPINQGSIAPLHLDLIAKHFGYSDEAALTRAIRSRKSALTITDITDHLHGLSAQPGYIKRVEATLKFKGVDRFFNKLQDAYRLSDKGTEAYRDMYRATARLHGMNLNEYIAQRFTGKVGEFIDPSELPPTHDTLLRAVRQTLRDKGKTAYSPDDPEVQQVLTRAREMATPPSQEQLGELQRVYDDVRLNPTAYQPAGSSVEHTHVMNGTTHVTGPVSTDQWKAMSEGTLGGGEAGNLTRIIDSSKWYPELPGMILSLMDGDVEGAAKVLTAWTYSQKSDGPVVGLQRVLNAYDRQKFASSAGMTSWMRDDLGLSREAIAAVMDGRPVEGGLGIKLYDFNGASTGSRTRVVGDLGPTPADRWAFRDAGFMDQDGLSAFMKAYGYKTPEEAGFLDPTPFYKPTGAVDKNGVAKVKLDAKAYDAALLEHPELQRIWTGVSPHQYEYVTRWMNGIAKDLNDTAWLGKTDWVPADVQAIGWQRVQNAFDAYPETGADMTFRNATQMVLEARPSETGPFQTLRDDWAQMSREEQHDLTAEMGAQTAATLSRDFGVQVVAYDVGTMGSWQGVVAPNFVVTIAGTGEQVDRALLSGIRLLGQDGGLAVREMEAAFAKSRPATGFYHAIDFIVPAGAEDDVAEKIANLPSMRESGFMPWTNAQGERVLRSVLMEDKPTTINAATARAQQLDDELRSVGLGDVETEVKGVHVKQHWQDWVNDPRGDSIATRLEGYGPAGGAARRTLWGDVGEAGAGGTRPLIGEFRTLSDDYARSILEERALRGRGAGPDNVSSVPARSLYARFGTDARGNATIPAAWRSERGYVYRTVNDRRVASDWRVGEFAAQRPATIYASGDHSVVLRVRDSEGRFVPAEGGVNAAENVQATEAIPASEVEVLGQDGNWLPAAPQETPAEGALQPDFTNPDTQLLNFQNDYLTRGATSLDKEGRVILWASKDAADPLTLMHELAHAAELHLDPSMRQRIIQLWQEDTGRARLRVAGAPAKTPKWTRATSEWFADLWIRNLRSGELTINDPELQRAFNYFNEWTDRAINKGLLKGEQQGYAVRGALTPEEGRALTKPVSPQASELLSTIMGGPKEQAVPHLFDEQLLWNSMGNAVRDAGGDAFRVNFFKRNRTMLERSVNHPMFGLYPASYMWGKVLPQMVRFMVKDPFGFPGGHVAWAANDVYRQMQAQSLADPNFAKQVDTLGKNGLIRLISLMLPATPWEMPVNAPNWARRVAEAGLTNEAAAKAGLPLKPNDPVKIWQDTMSYQFGAIPNAFSSVSEGVSGVEDLYSQVTGKPLKGKNAPSIGAGLTTLSQTMNQIGDQYAPLGEGMPSAAQAMTGLATPSVTIQDALDQNDELQSKLDDADSALQEIFDAFPFIEDRRQYQ